MHGRTPKILHIAMQDVRRVEVVWKEQTKTYDSLKTNKKMDCPFRINKSVLEKGRDI